LVALLYWSTNKDKQFEMLSGKNTNKNLNPSYKNVFTKLIYEGANNSK